MFLGQIGCETLFSAPLMYYKVYCLIMCVCQKCGNGLFVQVNNIFRVLQNLSSDNILRYPKLLEIPHQKKILLTELPIL